MEKRYFDIEQHLRDGNHYYSNEEIVEKIDQLVEKDKIKEITKEEAFDYRPHWGHAHYEFNGDSLVYVRENWDTSG